MLSPIFILQECSCLLGACAEGLWGLKKKDSPVSLPLDLPNFTGPLLLPRPVEEHVMAEEDVTCLYKSCTCSHLCLYGT